MYLQKQTCSLIQYAKMVRMHFVVLTHKLYGSVCLAHAKMHSRKLIVPVNSMLKWHDLISCLWRRHLMALFILDTARQQEYRSVSNTCSRNPDLNTNNRCMTTAYDLYLNFQASITLITELRRILHLQFIVTVLLEQSTITSLKFASSCD